MNSRTVWVPFRGASPHPKPLPGPLTLTLALSFFPVPDTLIKRWNPRTPCGQTAREQPWRGQPGPEEDGAGQSLALPLRQLHW